MKTQFFINHQYIFFKSSPVLVIFFLLFIPLTYIPPASFYLFFFSTFFFQYCGDINKTNSLCQSSSFDTVKFKP